MKGLGVLVEHGPVLQSDVNAVRVETAKITQIAIRVHWSTTPAWTVASSLEIKDRYNYLNQTKVKILPLCCLL